ncbi:MAG TPA: hypothetical protein VHY79_12075 [Rhizomicrobium sp.]|nr:hypothetical protein [Rhizomicrobium sp.]
MRLCSQRDLFQPDPEPALFEEQACFDGRVDPERIRLQLRSLLETARKAETMPWPERDARMWWITFPQLTNWLPPDEAHRLRLEFAQEMQRLALAV